MVNSTIQLYICKYMQIFTHHVDCSYLQTWMLLWPSPQSWLLAGSSLITLPSDFQQFPKIFLLCAEKMLMRLHCSFNDYKRNNLVSSLYPGMLEGVLCPACLTSLFGLLFSLLQADFHWIKQEAKFNKPVLRDWTLAKHVVCMKGKFF